MRLIHDIIANLGWSSRPRRSLADAAGGQQLLGRAAAAIRLGKLDLAEAFVRELGDSLWTDAACLNLLGLIAEARGEWSKAWRLWSRSARKDRHYQPPRQNLRRYFELFHFGRSSCSVAFHDSPR